MTSLHGANPPRVRAAAGAITSLLLGVLALLALAAPDMAATPRGSASRLGRTDGCVEVEVHTFLARGCDSSAVVFVKDRFGHTQSGASDRDCRVVFPRVCAGRVALWAARYAQDTTYAVLPAGDTLRVMVWTRQHGHVPSIYN